MGYYQQTLIPQQPARRVPADAGVRRYGGARRSGEHGTDGINAIVAYSDRPRGLLDARRLAGTWRATVSSWRMPRIRRATHASQE